MAGAGTCIQQMQKVLTQMNVQLANVLSDLSGRSGLEILKAILSGERDPYRLAALADRACRPAAKKSPKAWKGIGEKISCSCCARCMICISFISTTSPNAIAASRPTCKPWDPKVDLATQPLPQPTPLPRRKHIPQTNLQEELDRITGVDLTRIDGIQVQTAQVVLSETGVDMTHWEDEHHFSSWLGLCPNHQITGGKVIRRGTKKVLTAPPRPYAWPPKPCTTAKATWEPNTAACAPNSELPRPSPPWPTSWRA